MLLPCAALKMLVEGVWMYAASSAASVRVVICGQPVKTVFCRMASEKASNCQLCSFSSLHCPGLVITHFSCGQGWAKLLIASLTDCHFLRQS